MPAEKIAIRIDRELLARLDRLVRQKKASSRGRLVLEAIQDKVNRLDRTRLARECAKLDAKREQALADEGLATDFSAWPEY